MQLHRLTRKLKNCCVSDWCLLKLSLKNLCFGELLLDDDVILWLQAGSATQPYLLFYSPLLYLEGGAAATQQASVLQLSMRERN